MERRRGEKLCSPISFISSSKTRHTVSYDKIMTKTKTRVMMTMPKLMKRMANTNKLRRRSTLTPIKYK